MTSSSGKPLLLNGVIDRLEENRAVIKTDDGQTIFWPISQLPDGTTEGESINLTICSDKTKGEEKEKMAKDVLNEILKTNDRP